MDNRSSIDRLILDIDNEREYTTYLEGLLDNIEDYREEIEKISIVIPEEVDLPLIYDFFQKFTTKRGMLLDKISTSLSVDEETGLKKVGIGLSLTGKYSNFKQYISSLERSEKFFEIESFSFDSPEEITENFTFSLNVSTFFKGEESEYYLED